MLLTKIIIEMEESDVLILTRKVGETIIIGDDISMTVLGGKGNQVRIGINAPRDVAVHREEIYRRIKESEGNFASERDTASN